MGFHRNRRIKISVLVATLLLVFLWSSSHLGYINPHVPIWYSMLSITSAMVYKIDKDHARAYQQRIPEKWMHCIDLFGGWPGALIAQQAFQHKTLKASFKTVFWLTVMVNSTVLGLYLKNIIQDRLSI